MTTIIDSILKVIPYSTKSNSTSINFIRGHHQFEVLPDCANIKVHIIKPYYLHYDGNYLFLIDTYGNQIPFHPKLIPVSVPMKVAGKRNIDWKRLDEWKENELGKLVSFQLIDNNSALSIDFPTNGELEKKVWPTLSGATGKHLTYYELSVNISGTDYPLKQFQKVSSKRYKERAKKDELNHNEIQSTASLARDPPDFDPLFYSFMKDPPPTEPVIENEEEPPPFVSLALLGKKHILNNNQEEFRQYLNKNY